MKRAFTLAEVLITLGIIGVVAALTLPALIENYQKKVAAVRLEKFYTIMSQAVISWVAEDAIDTDNFQFDDSIIKNGENSKNWFDSTVGKYIQQDSILNTSNKQSYFDSKLIDGSGFVAYTASKEIMHFFIVLNINIVLLKIMMVNILFYFLLLMESLSHQQILIF